MFIFILGLLFCLAGLTTAFVFMRNKAERNEFGRLKHNENGIVTKKFYPYTKYAPFALVVSLILGVILVIVSCTVKVETGHTGIITIFGKVENTTYDAGFHFKAPWVKVVKMDNRVQKMKITMSGFSSDIQEVNCNYTLNYQIDKSTAQTLYSSVGKDYSDTAITPVALESVKTIVAHYTAEQLIENRDKLAVEIEGILSESLKKYNIQLVSTAIEDLDFTDTFTNAVEAKQVAAQNKLKAEIEQAQAIKQAQADAEVTKTKAEAQAEVAKIQAQADLEVTKIQADAAEYAGQKEAAKNKAISEWLSPELLKYYQIQQWDGKYPNYYVGSDNVSTIVGNSTINDK